LLLWSNRKRWELSPPPPVYLLPVLGRYSSDLRLQNLHLSKNF
jgi:hypothetical protein